MSKHTINENIVFNAIPHNSFTQGLFDTNKFEPFKICCGQCFNLSMTKPIIADRNVKGCEKNMMAMCAPNKLKRMEHYCGNCGMMMAIAEVPDTPGCAMCAPKPDWHRVIPDVEKFKLSLKNLGGDTSYDSSQ